MRAFPSGLKIVAGDAHATQRQPLSVTYWSCSKGQNAHWRTPHACKTAPDLGVVPDRRKSLLQLDVFFRDCWDGKHLDSPDHHSHMAHSRAYVCPASHPVKLPLIRLTVRYPISGGRDLHLASGGLLTGHADFLNAWNESFLTRLVDRCFHDRPCDPERFR
jgi:hypothetical protein